MYLQTYSQKEFKVLRTIEYLRFYMCVKVHFCEQKSPHVSMGGVKTTSIGEEAGKGCLLGDGEQWHEKATSPGWGSLRFKKPNKRYSFMEW